RDLQGARGVVLRQGDGQPARRCAAGGRGQGLRAHHARGQEDARARLSVLRQAAPVRRLHRRRPRDLRRQAQGHEAPLRRHRVRAVVQHRRHRQGARRACHAAHGREGAAQRLIGPAPAGRSLRGLAMHRAASLALGAAALLLLSPICLASPAEAAPDRERVLALLAEHRVPGAGIALIEGGKIDWVLGYGVREAGRAEPVTRATLFQAASISKPVAAFAAMRLVDQGKLRLDDDVNTWLASWRVPQNAFTRQQPVTLRLLLSHRAGVIVPGFPGYPAGAQVPTLLEVLEGKLPANTPAIVVDMPPAWSFRYSGGGFCILQQLLVDVTGAPFDVAMESLLLAPLGMASSTYRQPLPEARRSEAATGHQSRGAIEGRW